MGDFSLADLHRVNWGPTAKLALGRGVASSLVLTILMVFVGGARTSGVGGVVTFFFMGIGALAIGAPINFLFIKGLVAVFERMGLGIAVLAGNVMLALTAALVAAGDPLVYFVNRQFPHLFEVADLKPFNFKPAIFVLGGADHG